jgi:hypothetical protein
MSTPSTSHKGQRLNLPLGTAECGGAGVLVAECDTAVDEITDCLHPRPTRGRVKQLPCGFRKPISFAVMAAQKINQPVRWQIFDRMLNGLSIHRIVQATVADDAVGGQAHRFRPAPRSGCTSCRTYPDTA